MIQQPAVARVAGSQHKYLQQSLKISEGMPWIEVGKEAPYFITELGQDWTPIGQNDAITWPELRGMFLRKDLATAGAYFTMLVQHGVTCLRLMLEYCQREHRYFENPAGHFQPNMVRLWDDIFLLCEKHGLRILLTPCDTFWMWQRWSHHPYKTTNNGICDKRSQWLLSNNMRSAIKQRLAFATDRWGKSGALFAWDLWNEIHPAHAGNSVECFYEFVEDVGSFLKRTEQRLYGRCHPQTVSVFGPVLDTHPDARPSIFRHGSLDFSSVHFYESNTINNPKNTVDAAIVTGQLTRQAIREIENNRPFFDSEHGPIHAFKDKRKTLPEAFDDEYFLHMQWAHFASGGAGGGMRWPNRNPHSLTPGMRNAQQALARFLPLINWQQFKRRNLNVETTLTDETLSAFCCGDTDQAVLWILRVNNLNKKGMLDRNNATPPSFANIPGLRPGIYEITVWDTGSGTSLKEFLLQKEQDGFLCIPVPPVITNLAFAVKRVQE